jgi:hypothetical protein
MAASVAYGLCQQAPPGPALKYGVVVVMAVVRVAVNSLQWAADQAAMLEKQLELRLVNNIDCVQVAAAAAHNYAEVQTDFLVML